MAEDPLEPIRRGMRAAGMTGAALLSKTAHWAVDPKHTDTLIGSSLFQFHLDPTHDLSIGADDDMHPPCGLEESGYFRRTDWFRRTHGILTLELGPEPDRDEIYLSTLEWLPTVLRGPSVYEHHTGLAAYDAYIEKLADDDEFPAEDMTLLALHG
jgi:hypothetical protein